MSETLSPEDVARAWRSKEIHPRNERRPGESAEDHVERLLLEPLWLGATAAEIAAQVKCSSALVWRVRRDRETGEARQNFGGEFVELARKCARGIGWTKDDGGLPELLKIALVELELSACREGRCKHPLCERQRSAQEATQDYAATLGRPAHDTRPLEAGARPQSTAGAQPAEQSRGALEPKDSGGAKARSTC